MAVEKEAGSAAKKTITLVVLISLGVLIVLYELYSRIFAPPATPSTYNLNRVGANTSIKTAETPQYQQQLREYNAMKAKTAANQGGSYIASLNNQVAASSALPDKIQTASLSTPTTLPPDNSADNPAAQAIGAQDDAKEVMKAYLQSLNQRWKPTHMVMAGNFSSSTGNGDKAQENVFSNWTQSITPVANNITPGSPASPAIAPSPPMVFANSRMAGVIDGSVDSDNTQSIVLAHIPAGKLAGANLSAQGVQLAGDGITIHFSKMNYQGKTCAIDAYALDDESLQSSVQSRVNNRYFSRIILPAFANGLGAVGKLYENANTQVLTNNNSTVTGVTSPPDAKTVGGVVLGGMGEQAAQVMTADAGKLPVKQVIVNKNKVISVLFLKDVTDKDCKDNQ